MLSETALVMVRKSIELGYAGLCDIIEFREVLNTDKTTSFQEILVHSNIACKLSFATTNSSKDTELASGISQIVKLFIAPEVSVKPGSKFIVTQDYFTTEFENSGQPMMFPTHQEINLRLFKEWA